MMLPIVVLSHGKWNRHHNELLHRVLRLLLLWNISFLGVWHLMSVMVSRCIMRGLKCMLRPAR
jgi:hypothetical protein